MRIDNLDSLKGRLHTLVCDAVINELYEDEAIHNEIVAHLDNVNALGCWLAVDSTGDVLLIDGDDWISKKETGKWECASSKVIASLDADYLQAFGITVHSFSHFICRVYR